MNVSAMPVAPPTFLQHDNPAEERFREACELFSLFDYLRAQGFGSVIHVPAPTNPRERMCFANTSQRSDACRGSPLRSLPAIQAPRRSGSTPHASASVAGST